jgi:hypothetical protein
MHEDENALAEQVSGDDEDGQTGAVDPGYESEQEAQEVGEENHEEGDGHLSAVQKRVHALKRNHRKEIRELHDRISAMESMRSGDSANPGQQIHHNPYDSPGQPPVVGMNEEERIQHAVRMALGMKDHEERQAKNAEMQTHVHKQYQRLNDEFDNASEKYDDFDDVVRDKDMPFTPHVRDALLLVENPAEVAYKLGKNRGELERISKLHPLDQAREVNKLSFSLMGNHGNKPTANQKTAPMGGIRPNPVSSSTAVTGKTPPGEIRRRMKAGTWK